MPQVIAPPRPMQAALQQELASRRTAARRRYCEALTADPIDSGALLDSLAQAGYHLDDADDDVESLRLLPELRAAAATLPTVEKDNASAKTSARDTNRLLVEFADYIGKADRDRLRARTGALTNAHAARVVAANSAADAVKLAERRFASAAEAPPNADRVSAACAGASASLRAVAAIAAETFAMIDKRELPRVPRGATPRLPDARIRASLAAG